MSSTIWIIIVLMVMFLALGGLFYYIKKNMITLRPIDDAGKLDTYLDKLDGSKSVGDQDHELASSEPDLNIVEDKKPTPSMVKNVEYLQPIKEVGDSIKLVREMLIKLKEFETHPFRYYLFIRYFALTDTISHLSEFIRPIDIMTILPNYSEDDVLNTFNIIDNIIETEDINQFKYIISLLEPIVDDKALLGTLFDNSRYTDDVVEDSNKENDGEDIQVATPIPTPSEDKHNTDAKPLPTEGKSSDGYNTGTGLKTEERKDNIRLLAKYDNKIKGK